MAKIPYLFRRKNIYYFRLRVPAELRASLKASEQKKRSVMGFAIISEAHFMDGACLLY